MIFSPSNYGFIYDFGEWWRKDSFLISWEGKWTYYKIDRDGFERYIFSGDDLQMIIFFRQEKINKLLE